MEGGIADLSRYRLARAREMLEASEVNLEAGQYKTSLNRSYQIKMIFILPVGRKQSCS